MLTEDPCQSSKISIYKQNYLKLYYTYVYILINWDMSFECVKQVIIRSDTLLIKANNAHCIFFY